MLASYQYPQNTNVYRRGMQPAIQSHFWEKITYVYRPQEVQRKRYLPDILG